MIFPQPKTIGGHFTRLFFLITISFIFAQGFAILFSYIYLSNPTALQNMLLLAKQHPNFVKTLQLINSIMIFGVPAVLFPYLINKTPSDYLKIRNNLPLSSIIIAFSVIIVSIPFVNYLATFNSQLPLPQSLKISEASTEQLIKTLLKTNNFGTYLFNILVIALVPAIVEEFMFRGVLQQLFFKWLKNIHIAIFFAAFVFSFIHFQFMTFLPRLFLGLILGYLFYWSKNILTSITAHFFNNAIGVSVVYFMSSQAADKVNKIGAEVDTISILINIFIVILVLIASKKYFESKKYKY